MCAWERSLLHMLIFVWMDVRLYSLPLTVRCTQLPLWKVSNCCSNISTLHSYQPWSSERTFSIRREDLPCRVARPARVRQKWDVSRKGDRGEKDERIEFNKGMKERKNRWINKVYGEEKSQTIVKWNLKQIHKNMHGLLSSLHYHPELFMPYWHIVVYSFHM